MRKMPLSQANITAKGGEQMNYELVLLRNALRMKRNAKILTKEMQLIALRSYNTLNWRDGTMGQLRAIEDYSQQIDRLTNVYNLVERALLIVPAGYRALLVAVYFRNKDKNEIAKRYRVSRSTVYRRLYRARELFCQALQSIGCDKEWFVSNLSDLDWIDRLPTDN